MKNNYSEKEINIFNGVLRLAQNGEDLSKITARQIAASAGVGKATIYDYFSSKEEIVMGALLYSMSIEAAQFALAMEQTASFKDKMYTIYQGIISRVENTGSIFHIMLGLGGTPKTNQPCDSINPHLEQLIMEFVQILYTVLQCGYQQGIIGTDVSVPANHSYVHMVLFGNIFATARRAADKHCPQPHHTIIEDAYKMLVKALG